MDYRQRIRRKKDPDSTSWDGVGGDHTHEDENEPTKDQKPAWDGVGEGDEPGEYIEQKTIKKKK